MAHRRAVSLASAGWPFACGVLMVQAGALRDGMVFGECNSPRALILGRALCTGKSNRNGGLLIAENATHWSDMSTKIGGVTIVRSKFAYKFRHGSICHQHADAPHAASLLRTRRERPRRGRAAEQRYELAAFHCPMPSRASDRKDSTPQYGRRLLRCGISIPLMSEMGS
jgi:hypothetical protein